MLCCSLPFGEFANNTAIQCTEVYEFAQSLGNPLFVAISFQSFKMIYALRLLEAGLAEQVCTILSVSLLSPFLYTPLIHLSTYKFERQKFRYGRRNEPKFGTHVRMDTLT